MGFDVFLVPAYCIVLNSIVFIVDNQRGASANQPETELLLPMPCHVKLQCPPGVVLFFCSSGNNGSSMY